MQEEIRRAIAHAALSRATGRPLSYLFNGATGRYLQMTICSETVYDPECKSHILHNGERLFHYGLHAHILLRVNGSSITGYDHHSKQSFSGRVNGNSLQLYDSREKRFFYYAAPPLPEEPGELPACPAPPLEPSQEPAAALPEAGQTSSED